jgi:tetratricopeptide (TPR) repeat protein
MENNLANIYHMLKMKEKAEKHWNNAIRTNSSIGNIEQQGGILFNYGVYYFESCNFEKAIEQYQIALSIFKAIGDELNTGIILTNTGEAHLMMCEYKQAKDKLNSSIKLYEQIKNYQGKSEALFLFGKLMYKMNCFSAFKKTIYTYENLDATGNQEKTSVYLSYLKLMGKILSNKGSETLIRELIEIKEKMENYSDIFSLGEIWIEIIYYYLFQESFSNALEIINSEGFINICKENIFFDSYRDWLLGKVSESLKSKELEHPLIYYEKALEKNNSISITELTLKILFDLYRTYKIRGQISKMSEFKRICQLTINFLVGNFDLLEEKENYLQKSEIITIVNELKNS